MYIHTAFMAISQKNSAKEQIRFFGFSNSQVTIFTTQNWNLSSAEFYAPMTFVIVAVTRNPKSYDSLVLKKYLMCLTGLIEFFFCCRVGTKIKYFTIILEVLLVNKVYYFYEPVAWLFFKLLHPRWNQRLLLSIYVCPLNCY